MPKTYNNLYSAITSFANLHEAWRKAAKGKRSIATVASFEYALEDELFALQRELLTQHYQPGAYRSFYIQDPKLRLISAAPFRDRVVHHALCNVIEPLFERTFIGDSYANRLGKGTHRALDRAQAWAQNYDYVLQCDLKQFFPSIDHALLKQTLDRKIADPKARWLYNQIIDSGAGINAEAYEMVWFQDDDLFAAFRPRGLPIGNLTSQFWANVYLNQLDQFVKRNLRCKPYLRYVDDFLLFSNSKTQLWQWRTEINDFLASLRLKMHMHRSTVFPVKNGIPVLGFQVYPFYKRVKTRNARAFSRRLKTNLRHYARQEIDKATLDARINGWVAHVAHGQTWKLRQSLFSQHQIPKPE